MGVNGTKNKKNTLIIMEWKDITLEKYYRLKTVVDAPFSDTKTFEILSVLHDKHIAYFENLPSNILVKLINESKFIYESKVKEGIPLFINCGGNKYLVEREVSNLTSGQYIDLTGYCKSEVIINQSYHNIISIFLSPVNVFGNDIFKKKLQKAKTKEEQVVVYEYIFNERKKIAEHLKQHLTMDVVFQISHYFFLLYQNLTNSIMDYSQIEVNKAMRDLKKALQQNGMQDIGDGILL